MDLIHQLGPLAFATRLKRLSERLQKDVSRVYKDLDYDFQARWFPVLYALSEDSPQAVTELSEELGLTHPAVNQIAGSMERRGFLTSDKDPRDERRRLLRLTESGVGLVKKLRPVWRDVARATGELLQETGVDVLAVLSTLEQSLNGRDMYSRMRSPSAIARKD